MKIYLASRYSRRLELCEYRRQLEALGHSVTSRWLNGNHQISDAGVPIGEDGESLVEGVGEPLTSIEGDDGSLSQRAVQLRQHFAMEDLCDVKECDLLIAFTEPPRSSASRGGRHIELGLALGWNKTVVVVGHRENIFCWLAGVNYFETFESALPSLKKGSSSCISR